LCVYTLIDLHTLSTQTFAQRSSYQRIKMQGFCLPSAKTSSQCVQVTCKQFLGDKQGHGHKYVYLKSPSTVFYNVSSCSLVLRWVWKEIVASFFRTEFESNDVMQSSITMKGSGRKLLPPSSGQNSKVANFKTNVFKRLPCYRELRPRSKWFM